MDRKSLEAVIQAFAETSRHLSDTADSLVRNAVAAGIPPPKGVPPTDIPGITAAIAAGAPISVPAAGLPVAKVLSQSAVPVARSAPIVALGVPVFAPALNK